MLEILCWILLILYCGIGLAISILFYRKNHDCDIYLGLVFTCWPVVLVGYSFVSLYDYFTTGLWDGNRGRGYLEPPGNKPPPPPPPPRVK